MNLSASTSIHCVKICESPNSKGDDCLESRLFMISNVFKYVGLKEVAYSARCSQFDNKNQSILAGAGLRLFIDGSFSFLQFFFEIRSSL